MNKVLVYEVWKSGFRHQIIQLTDGTTLDFRPKDNVRISCSSVTLKGKDIVSSSVVETLYSDAELIRRAQQLKITWNYFAPTRNCEDFKNMLLLNQQRSETREKIVALGIGAFIGLLILRTA